MLWSTHVSILIPMAFLCLRFHASTSFLQRQIHIHQKRRIHGMIPSIHDRCIDHQCLLSSDHLLSTRLARIHKHRPLLHDFLIVHLHCFNTLDVLLPSSILELLDRLLRLSLRRVFPSHSFSAPALMNMTETVDQWFRPRNCFEEMRTSYISMWCDVSTLEGWAMSANNIQLFGGE